MDISLCENIIIKLLFTKEELRDRLISYLTPEIFDDYNNIAIMKVVKTFYEKFEKIPTVAEVKVELPSQECIDRFMANLNIDLGEYSNEYLLDECQTFMRMKLTINNFSECSECLKEADFEKAQTYTDKIRESLAFSFTTALGLDFLEEEERIYNFLHNRETVVPYGINFYDRNTKGGAHEKSLTLFIAETGLGKTLTLCSLASNVIRANRKALYITCEMAEDKISERIIANIWDENINELDIINREQFHRRFTEMKAAIQGRLHVKEYPPGKITANDIRNLLKEYEIKKKFVPEILYVDYLGLMRSSYSKKSDNTYTEGKRTVEELRAVAVEYKLPIISAIQTSREGFGSAEVSLKHTADSAGYAFTADVVFSLAQPAELVEAGQYATKILKNRYGFNGLRELIGVDKLKMRLTDSIEDNAQSFGPHRRPASAAPVAPIASSDDPAVQTALSLMSDSMGSAAKSAEKSVFGNWE
jgi:replicative DNA helicase